jgi:L-lactate dehydrogenase
MKDRSIFKVGIIGCGRVGATIAYTLMLEGTVTNLVLFDVVADKAEGEKLDLEHGLPLLDMVNIKATTEYKDIKDCGIVIVTAGFAQKPGETRLDLCQKNKMVITEVVKNLNKVNSEAIIIMVTNPVDVLTQLGNQLLNKGKNNGRIFGTGTLLDTSRFRYYLGEEIKVNPKSIHAYVLGEHGDNSFPAYKSAIIGGEKLIDFPGISQKVIDESFEKTKKAAAEIIKRKGATYYGIAVMVNQIVEAILSNAKTIFPLSVTLNGEYGIQGVALSVPCEVGLKGVERILEIELSKEENERMLKAANILKEFDKIG